MNIPKQNINYEITEVNTTHEKITLFNVYNLTIGVFILIGYIIYSWMISENRINTTNIFDSIERKMKEWKEYFTFHTNKLLLQLSMDGNAIKTTQPASYSIETKSSLFQ